MKKLILFALLMVLSINVNAADYKFRGGVFLHNSTGGRIWGSTQGQTSVPEEITAYNSSHGYRDENACAMSETNWPLNPWANDWYRWNNIFADNDPNADIDPYLTGNKIIIIKSGYPSSDMSGYGQASDTLTPTVKSIYNYKYHWRAFLKVMESHPENFFVIWTNAPLVASQTDSMEALFSHQFCTWAKDTLAAGLDPVYGDFPDNVYVFDFFHKLAGSDNYLQAIYADGLDDSHPNGDGTDLVAPLLVQEVFNASIFYESNYNPPAPQTPEQIQPVDDSLYVELIPEFVWHTANYATAYDIEVATDVDFAEIVAQAADQTDTVYSPVSPLEFDTEYFWRVNSTDGIVKSDWSGTWTFTTVPDRPTTPTLLFPYDNSSNVPLGTVLTWTECEYAETYTLEISYDDIFIDIYLSDTTLTDTTISLADYTSLLYFKTYYWRVRGENEIHKGDWSATFQLETLTGVPETPVLVYPGEADSTVPREILFTWKSALNADEYQIQVSKQDYFSMLEFEHTTADTFYLRDGFDYGETYYWRVRSKNHPQESAWTLVNEFRIIDSQPDAPAAVYPEAEQLYVSQTPEFKWTEIEDADAYSFRVATDEEFTNIVLEKEKLTGLLYQTISTESLEMHTVYYWQLKAHNKNIDGLWSGSYQFTTIMFDAHVPLLLAPANNSENIEIPLTFVWNAADNAETYTLRVSDSDEFIENVLRIVEIVDTNLTLDISQHPMLDGTKYYWQVQAVNGNSASEWSDIFNYTTEFIAPGTPENVYPGNSELNVPVKTVFRWNAVDGADSYEIQIAKDEEFTEGLFESAVEEGHTFVYPNNLAYESQYFWHVRAINKGGASLWSDTYIFTTETDLAVEDYSGAVTDFKVSPNPMQEAATVSFNISESAIIRLSVHDIAGNELLILTDNIRQGAGNHSVKINTKELNISSGVLIFRLRIGNSVFVEKAVLMK